MINKKQNDKLYEENKQFYDLQKNKCISKLISRFTNKEMMLQITRLKKIKKK